MGFFLGYSAIVPLAFVKQNEVVIRVAWLMTFLLGLIVVLHGIVSSIDGYHSKNWPQAKANLQECFVRYWHSDETYVPVVKYEFYVDSQRYTGNNIDFSDFSGSEAGANQKVNGVKNRADNLYIYYKPSDPSLSVIEPGLHFVHPIRFIFGLALLIISALSMMGIIQS